ncbi:XrtA/PEP-CTERM system TPR-repeat protein PrsT [Salinisphaera sp. T31B1]|uniref:XrtA/PEP-CTERM system TPR-repeat protein PrsT n=1 Tax=Salinisphaera sp. T31B1 TaxID=727963 RepID=UPI00334042C2
MFKLFDRLIGAVRVSPSLAVRLTMLGVLVALTGCGSDQSPADRQALAQQSLASGNYREAEIRLKSVLREQPDNAEAWRMLGQTSLATYRYADASHQFERARQAGDGSTDTQLNLARAMVGDGQFQPALDLLADLSGMADSHQAAAQVLRGEALAGLERPDDAAQAYAAALEADPNSTEALLGQASLAAGHEQPEKAQRLLERAAQTAPDDMRVVAAQARLSYEQNGCDQAVGGFEKALGASSALSPAEQYRLRLFLSDCQIRLDRLDAAQDNVSRLAKATPDSAFVNYLQALIHIRRADYDAAAQSLERVLNVAPDNVRSLTLLAWVNIVRNDPATAQQYLGRVLAQSPADINALRLQTGLYLQQEQPQQALSMLEDVYQDNADAPGLRPLIAAVQARLKPAAEGDASGAPAAADDKALQIDLVEALLQQGNGGAAAAVLDKIEPADAEQKEKVARLRVQIALANGDRDQAVESAEALAKAYPDSSDAQRVLARVYAADGRVDAAKQRLEAFRRGHSSDMDVVQDLAALQLRTGRADQAVALLAPIHDDRPDDDTVVRLLAAAYAQAGQPAQAISLLEATNRARPGDLDIATTLVRAYISFGEPAKAAVLAGALSEDRPDNHALLRLYGVAQLADGQADQALSTLERAARQAGDDSSYQLDLAQAQMASGHDADAVKTLQPLVDRTPPVGAAIRLLAMAQAGAGDLEAALATADRLAEPASQADADRLGGDVLASIERFQQAAERYAKAYAAAPDAGLAIALFDARRRANAEAPAEALSDWLKRAPDDTRVRLLRAQWRQSENEQSQAADDYRQVLERAPDNAVALNNLALIYQDQNDPRATDLARRALKLSPDNANIQDTAGWILVNTGQEAEGIELLNKAVSADNPSETARYHLAVALSRSDDDSQRARARQILVELLAGDEEFVERKQASELLESLNEVTGEPSS